MKVSEWLAQHSSHSIYDAKAIAENFQEETGLKACWSSHSAQEMIGMIKARGLGGSLEGDQPVIAGYEIAEALAERLTNSESHRRFHGRGSRFDAALIALQQANL